MNHEEPVWKDMPLKEAIVAELEMLWTAREGNSTHPLAKALRELVDAQTGGNGPFNGDERLNYLEAEGQIVMVCELCSFVAEETGLPLTVGDKEDGNPNATFYQALSELRAEQKIIWNEEKEYVALVSAPVMTPEQATIEASRRAYMETDEYKAWRDEKLATMQTEIQKARGATGAGQ